MLGYYLSTDQGKRQVEHRDRRLFLLVCIAWAVGGSVLGVWIATQLPEPEVRVQTWVTELAVYLTLGAFFVAPVVIAALLVFVLRRRDPDSAGTTSLLFIGFLGANLAASSLAAWWVRLTKGPGFGDTILWWSHVFSVALVKMYLTLGLVGWLVLFLVLAWRFLQPERAVRLRWGITLAALSVVLVVSSIVAAGAMDYVLKG